MLDGSLFRSEPQRFVDQRKIDTETFGGLDRTHDWQELGGENVMLPSQPSSFMPASVWK